MTLYGPVYATAEFAPTAGMPVTATVNGVVCGQTQLLPWDGGLAYKIQVTSDTGDGCGSAGQEIQLQLNEWTVASDYSWDNSQAWYRPLDAYAPPGYTVYLSVVVKEPVSGQDSRENEAGGESRFPLASSLLIMLGPFALLLNPKRVSSRRINPR